MARQVGSRSPLSAPMLPRPHPLVLSARHAAADPDVAPQMSAPTPPGDDPVPGEALLPPTEPEPTPPPEPAPQPEPAAVESYDDEEFDSHDEPAEALEVIVLPAEQAKTEEDGTQMLSMRYLSGDAVPYWRTPTFRSGLR